MEKKIITRKIGQADLVAEDLQTTRSSDVGDLSQEVKQVKMVVRPVTIELRE